MCSLKFVSLTTLALAFAGYCTTASARFIESDPIGLGGGINTYSYVRGNPVTRVDPFGLADLNLFDPTPFGRDAAQTYPGGNAWSDPNYYTVAGHGNPGNMEDDRKGTWPWVPLRPKDLADIIKADKNWKNRPVKIGACNVGRSWPQGYQGRYDWEPFDQTLSKLLGVPVVGPTEFARYSPKGLVGTSLTEEGQISTPGNWKTSYPNGH